jgi:hypothetical protein
VIFSGARFLFLPSSTQFLLSVFLPRFLGTGSVEFSCAPLISFRALLVLVPDLECCSMQGFFQFPPRVYCSAFCFAPLLPVKNHFLCRPIALPPTDSSSNFGPARHASFLPVSKGQVIRFSIHRSRQVHAPVPSLV